MLVHCLLMRFEIAAAEKAAMDLRMQRLDPPIHHFREAGMLGDLFDRKSGLPQHLGGAAGREQFHVVAGQTLGQFQNSIFITNREQGSPDWGVRTHLPLLSSTKGFNISARDGIPYAGQ